METELPSQMLSTTKLLSLMILSID
jgi:hypothetical protein